MKLTSPSQVRALLQERDIQPLSALGQNFLIDANIRDMIVQSADPGPGDVVLEIGPGLGVLTESLAERAGRLVAVEKDRKLYAFLEEKLGGRPGVRLIHGDGLALGEAFFAEHGVTKVVSNLPYSVGSRILMNLFAMAQPPARITVTVQLEVGERLMAGPGEPERGLLGVWAQRSYAVEIRKIVSPTCFCPPPKVRSAIVQLDRLAGTPANGAFFRKLTKEAFGYRRKQLGSILNRIGSHLGLAPVSALQVLEILAIDPKTRPEVLSVAQWQAMADAMERAGDCPSGQGRVKSDS